MKIKLYTKEMCCKISTAVFGSDIITKNLPKEIFDKEIEATTYCDKMWCAFPIDGKLLPHWYVLPIFVSYVSAR